MSDKTRLLLMAEFGTEESLWLRSSEGKAAGSIPLDCLPLSAELKQRLRTWARRHDQLNDPPFSWGSIEEAESLAGDGRVLLIELRNELGADYDVKDPPGN